MLNDRKQPYPRLCAHRGVHLNYAPENSLPAFEKALELGAPEIEIDLWPSRDGELFVYHNKAVEMPDGELKRIVDLSSEELKALDIGGSSHMRGIRIPTFEEALNLLAGVTILNIHIKSLYANAIKTPRILKREADTRHWNHDNVPIFPPLPDGIEDVDEEVEHREIIAYNRKDFQHILDALDRHHCRDYVYIAGEREVLGIAREMAPDIARCCLEAMNFMTVETAIRYDCQKVQFNKGLTTQAMMDKAHEHGMRCNMFWSNIPEEAKAYFDAGMDCILTDDYAGLRHILS